MKQAMMSDRAARYSWLYAYGHSMGMVETATTGEARAILAKTERPIYDNSRLAFATSYGDDDRAWALTDALAESLAAFVASDDPAAFLIAAKGEC